MLDLVINLAMAAISVSIILLFYRLEVGPTIPDRALALETIATNVLALVVLLSIKMHTVFFFDVALVLAVLGFVGTTALAKFIAKGVIIERDSD
ncbi:MAG: monovalent cation/H+ antiporter complex subunit F [Bacillota bacterium]